ncbi:LruC domain-containing protein [Pedobacter duraquae]|uniref:LruC domain-containing protein n=1 Tax=Pedobacter duraquae TaxID=425511 RepID=A0A4V3C360_9SPHI|nr:LruC domain-containing protein [Pedobacter duraquae]TDO20839.1 LruC domain-containing protein [Pedobacter duraquae]
MNLKLRTLLFGSIALFAACKKDNSVEIAATNKALTELAVPASFNWQTSRDVSLSIGIDNISFDDKLHVIAVYLTDPANGGTPISKGAASIIKPFNTKISVPTTINEVYVVKTSPDGVSVTTKLALTSERVSIGLSSTNSAQTVSLAAPTPTITDPACEVSTSGSVIIVPKDKVMCYTTSSNSIVAISASTGGTLKINSNGKKVTVVSYTHTATKIIVAKGSVVEFSTPVSLGATESIINSGDLTFNSSLYLTSNSLLQNAGTFESNSIFSVAAGAAVFNTGDFDANYVASYATINGTFTNRSDAKFVGLNITSTGVFENECKLSATAFTLNGTLNNYSSFRNSNNSSIASIGELNQFSGAVFQTGTLLSMYGVIEGHGTPSLVKVLSGVTTVLPTTKVTGAIQLCGTNIRTSYLSNGAELGCDLYIPVTDCNPVLNGTAPIIQLDTDGDGIIDLQDAYPNDASKAFKNYSVNYLLGGSTIAFEDSWPSKGDYDLNDVVLNSKYMIATNANNVVVQVTADYVLKATGADYNNGAGVQFNLPAASAKVVSATAGAFLEAGQDSVVVVLFADSKKEQPTGNTVPGAILSPVKNYSIVFDITNGPVLSAFGIGTYNPFIWNNTSGMGRGYETHLYGKLPTKLADKKLFGTKDDKSVVGKYYSTAGNLPWAVELPIANFGYMNEGVDVTKGYTKFADWANSGGTAFPDWYSNPLYIVLTSIFLK